MSQGVPHTDNFINSHYDPAIQKLQEALDAAKETGASAKVIESIEGALRMSKQRDEFAEQLSSAHSKTCAGIVHETVTHDWKKAFEEKKTTWNLNPIMMSGHLEGQFLKSFLSAQKAKRVLDIGTYTGYSAMSIAEALPADGEVVTLELQEYLKPIVEDLIKDSPHKNKVRMIIGPAIQTMTTLKDNGEKFDAVFMDAAKSEYAAYMKICLEDNLLSPGGTMIIDNAFLHGNAYLNPDSAVAKFASHLKSMENVHVLQKYLNPNRSVTIVGDTEVVADVRVWRQDKSPEFYVHHLHQQVFCLLIISVLVPVRDGIYLVRRREDVDGGVAQV